MFVFRDDLFKGLCCFILQEVLPYLNDERNAYVTICFILCDQTFKRPVGVGNVGDSKSQVIWVISTKRLGGSKTSTRHQRREVDAFVNIKNINFLQIKSCLEPLRETCFHKS